MQDLHSGTITRAYCRAIYEESVSRCFILPLCTSCIGCASRSKKALSLPIKGPSFRLTDRTAGEVRRSRIGGGERSEPISRMLIIPYDIESQSRNALVSP